MSSTTTAAQAEALTMDGFVAAMEGYDVELDAEMGEALKQVLENGPLVEAPIWTDISARLQSSPSKIAAIHLLNVCMQADGTPLCLQFRDHPDYLVQGIVGARLALAEDEAASETLFTLLHSPDLAPLQQQLLKTFCLDLGLQPEVMTASEIQSHLLAMLNPVPLLQIGERAPDFSVSDRQGKPVTLAQFQGQTLLIHFWAVACPGCLEQIPSLKQQLASFQDRQPAILWVNLDHDHAVFEEALAQLELPGIQVWADIQGAFAQSFGIRIIPFDVVINPDGTIRGYGVEAIEDV